VALARKAAKSRTYGRKLRSTGTKAKTRAGTRELRAELERKLAEALEQQTATSDILGVISRSPADVRAVLDAMCQSAARLCEAYDAAIWRPDGDRLLLVAHHGPIAQVNAVPLVRGSCVGRSVLEKCTVHIADIPTQADEFPITCEYARRWGFRTGLWVPLIREGAAIGVIALRRTQAQLFSERQVALLQTFADQAVIAIENTRLLNELRQRTDDLAEALEQQTATWEVLQVISSSPGELEPVFQAMLENATMAGRCFPDFSREAWGKHHKAHPCASQIAPTVRARAWPLVQPRVGHGQLVPTDGLRCAWPSSRGARPAQQFLRKIITIYGRLFRLGWVHRWNLGLLKVSHVFGVGDRVATPPEIVKAGDVVLGVAVEAAEIER